MSTDLIEQPAKTNGVMAVATTRQSQEVQAAMVVAKQYPRDETAAIARIAQSCKRRGLAEVAMYAYPKGGTKVTGPSIRLAEAIAQAWGNIDYGVIELEQKPGESVAMAYCWDLETNVRRQMVFTVKHIRSTKNGNVLLTDPRDIYEMVANQGARRVRSCILGVIPGDIEDFAVLECEKTLKSGSKEPIQDRVRKMVTSFQDYSVTIDMLEARLGHIIDACGEQDIVNMTKIYISLRDGMSKREDWFDAAPAKKADDAAGGSRVDQVKRSITPATKPTQDPAATEPAVDLSEQIDAVRKSLLDAEPDLSKRVAIYKTNGVNNPGEDAEFDQFTIDALWSVIESINEGKRE